MGHVCLRSDGCTHCSTSEDFTVGSETRTHISQSHRLSDASRLPPSPLFLGTRCDLQKIFSILLEAMDRWRHLSGLRVFFLATCPDSTALDPSLLQTGRLGVVLRLGSLDVSSRAAILGVHARAIPLRFHVPAVNAEASSTQEKLSGEGNEARSSSESSPADLPGVYAKGNSENVLEWEREPSPPTIGVGRALDVLRVTACLPQTRDEFLRLIAARCHGYLGSDLERLCREAAMIHISTGAGASPVHYSGLSNADTAVGFHHGVTSGADPVALEDFWEALDVVRPASLVGHSIGLSSTDADSKARASHCRMSVVCCDL